MHIKRWMRNKSTKQQHTTSSACLFPLHDFWLMKLSSREIYLYTKNIYFHHCFGYVRTASLHLKGLTFAWELNKEDLLTSKKSSHRRSQLWYLTWWQYFRKRFDFGIGFSLNEKLERLIWLPFLIRFQTKSMPQYSLIPFSNNMYQTWLW